MSGLKRKASVQITRNSVPFQELPLAIPHTAPSTFMGIIQSVVAKGQDWYTSWCATWYPVLSSPTDANMAPTSTKTAIDTHIQTSKPRNDGPISQKRQKIRRPRATSAESAMDQYHKGGRGTLDITSCDNETDASRRVDAFWIPPDTGLLRKKSRTYTLPPKSPEYSREGPRQRSASQPEDYGASAYPSPSPSSSSSSRSPKSIRRSDAETAIARKAPIPESLSGDEPGDVKARTTIDDLGEQMKHLLESDEELEENRGREILFVPSGLFNERRARLAKERKVKEREAAIQAAKERRLKRRFPQKALVQPMSPDWESKVDEATFMHDPFRIITTSIGGTELRTKDFATLLGNRAWLNDEIINSYIEWIVDAANKSAAAEAVARGEPPSTVPKFIAHNSFFYQNIVKKGPGSTANLMKRKKAPGASLLEVDSVFVPICSGNHWTIGVVRPVAKTIEYFDSMGGDSRHFIHLMRNWLQFQLGDAYVESEWKRPRTACARQNNGYDCGVFVCTNAYCIAMGLDTSCYYESDMLQQRRNIAAVLINKGFVKGFAWNSWGV